MYARTSKPQEGFTCEDSRAKCFKTMNSTAKMYRGAMYRGEVLRECFRHFMLCFNFRRNLGISTQESNANSTEISINKTQFLTCNSQGRRKGGGH